MDDAARSNRQVHSAAGARQPETCTSEPTLPHEESRRSFERPLNLKRNVSFAMGSSPHGENKMAPERANPEPGTSGDGAEKLRCGNSMHSRDEHN